MDSLAHKLARGREWLGLEFRELNPFHTCSRTLIKKVPPEAFECSRGLTRVPRGPCGGMSSHSEHRGPWLSAWATCCPPPFPPPPPSGADRKLLAAGRVGEPRAQPPATPDTLGLFSVAQPVFLESQRERPHSTHQKVPTP